MSWYKDACAKSCKMAKNYKKSGKPSPGMLKIGWWGTGLGSLVGLSTSPEGKRLEGTGRGAARGLGWDIGGGVGGGLGAVGGTALGTMTGKALGPVIAGLMQAGGYNSGSPDIAQARMLSELIGALGGGITGGGLGYLEIGRAHV